MTERERWEARHRAAAHSAVGAPSEWVVERVLAQPPDALVLDIASGRGRHAIPIAAAGRRVVVLDVSGAAVHAARQAAPALTGAVVADAGALPLRAGCAGVVLCVNFLDRALVPHLVRVLRSGGALIVETFTTAQLRLGRGPRSPAHLLHPGELRQLVHPLPILEYAEGLVRDAAGERYVARLVAVNDRASGTRPATLGGPA